MSAPQPPSALQGHCSAVHDDTLYVLSPDSFLSLPLASHAQWSKEPMGVAVTGAACAQSDTDLFVVGGSTNAKGYSGMQKYNFASKQWQTLSVDADVLARRTAHSVAYLEDTQQILVYAGSQPFAPSFLSSQTFVVSAVPPYEILSFTSEAPPGNLPILQAWNSSHAVMVGGSDFNIEVFTFGPTEGWQQLDTNLTAPLDPTSRATMIDGSDGSKVMNIYDMSKSPNTVTPVVLLGPGGQTASTGEIAGSSSSRKRKRDLTLSNWPPYSAQNAPQVTRTDCAVAQGPSGLAVISGGSSQEPVALFNEDRNSWVNVDSFFDSKQQQPLKPTKSSPSATKTPTSTSTSSSSPSHTTAAASSGTGQTAHQRMLRTLGITLGVLCGIAAIFIIVLLLLRWRKMKKRREQGYLDEKNDDRRMSFQDRGASFMKEAGGSINELAPPNKGWNSSMNGSHSSLAIIAGRFGSKRNTSNHEPKPSYDSTAPIWDRNIAAQRNAEQMEMMNLDEKKIERKPVPRVEPTPPSAPYGPNLTVADATVNRKSTDTMDSARRNRSSGWSKYFATSHPEGPNGISHLPSGYLQSNKMSDMSVYSTDGTPAQHPPIPSSILVAPLDIDFSRTVDGQRLSHVTSGSPAYNDSREDLARSGNASNEGQRGLIVDPLRKSASDTISSYNRSTMSTTTSEFYHENLSNGTGTGVATIPWTPTSGHTSFKDHLNARPPSSIYPPSEPRVPSRGKGGGSFFPGPGISYRPGPSKSRINLGSSAAPTSVWASPTPRVVDGPTAAGAEDDAGLSAFPKPPGVGTDGERDSTATVFPKGVPSAYYAGRERAATEGDGRGKPVNSDLGWLNLGLGRESPNAGRI